MRVRILYTNGTKTIVPFWIRHDGKNVYCGNAGVDHHISYHESGKLHVKLKGDALHEKMCVPLAKLAGKYNILTSMFPNKQWQFDNAPGGVRTEQRSWPREVEHSGLPGDLLIICAGRDHHFAARLREFLAEA